MMQASSDTLTHYILGGGTIASLIAAGVSFGMLKSDTKHVKADLIQHNQDDDKRFDRLTETLDKIDGKIDNMHTDVTVLVTKDKQRELGMIRTRETDRV